MCVFYFCFLERGLVGVGVGVGEEEGLGLVWGLSLYIRGVRSP
jgi:hypothetical protein